MLESGIYGIYKNKVVNKRRIIINKDRFTNPKDKVQINENITSKEVRLVGNDGENYGVVATSKALQMADKDGLDLVIVSPNQEPPVAKIMNYGKYKYEVEKRAKEAKKKQHVVEVKEVKLRYKIDTHDYNVRLKSIQKFLAQDNKVKIVVMLRGREMQHSQLAFDLATRLLADLEETPMVIEKKPSMEGRNVIVILAPNNK